MTQSTRKSRRQKLIDQIKALRAKTVDNNCTEAEALSAAEAVSRLLDKYDLDEAEISGSAAEGEEFVQRTQRKTDDVGDRLWRPAAAIQKLTGTKYWISYGDLSRITFFGRDADVEVAFYLLAICEGAMRRGVAEYGSDFALLRSNIRQRKAREFLDGMASRLTKKLEEIHAARQSSSTGRALVLSKDHEVDKAAKKLAKFKSKRGRKLQRDTQAFADGEAGASKVAFNEGLGADFDADVLLGEAV